MRFPAFALGGVLAIGCNPSVEIDAPDIEVTQPNLQFHSALAGAGAGTSATGFFQISTAKLGAASNPDAGTLKNIERLQITRVVFKADTGISDFSFLDHLTVMGANLGYATQSSPGRPVVQILDYQADPDVLVGAVLDLPLDPPVDMLPLWGYPRLYLTFTATGAPPQVDWSIDVVFSLSLKITQ
jgi:hypothetical protein